jgi:hypothetical protein
MTAPVQETPWPVAGEGGAAQFAVPSGQSITLQDIFWEEGDDLILRVRFIAPQIARAGGTVDHDTAGMDMLHLCQTYVLPQISGGVDTPSQIILTLSDIAVPFGDANPEATQFFEAYSFDGSACISEVF